MAACRGSSLVKLFAYTYKLIDSISQGFIVKKTDGCLHIKFRRRLNIRQLKRRM